MATNRAKTTTQDSVEAGYYYVNVSEVDHHHRSWADMRRYGFISAGGGTRYSNALDTLKIGYKIFAYQKSNGYVGYGTVVSLKQIASEFEVSNGVGFLLDQELDQPNLAHDQEDLSLADYVVGIRWIKTKSSDNALKFDGMFTFRKIVCRLNNQKTIEFLEEKFIGISKNKLKCQSSSNNGSNQSPLVPPIISDQRIYPAPIADLSDTRSTRGKRWEPLEKITVCDFKAVKRAEIPVGDAVTILVGPNSCGKSSILQAIHWATRSASNIKPKNQSGMVLFGDLDYIPSSDPIGMFHNGRLGTNLKSSPIEVKFQHKTTQGDDLSAKISLRTARNKGGISVRIDGQNAVTPYKQKYKFISAYIPGLAGVAETETTIVQSEVWRKAASGEAGGVLRNILLLLAATRPDDDEPDAGEKRLSDLNSLICRVFPDLTIDVLFNERDDRNISAKVSRNGKHSRTLEVAATGEMQVIQIFSYLVLFRPRLTLIEEPESHLHPNVQSRLIRTLEWAAKEFETQIILTTHSPHIVRESSFKTEVVWMQDGRVKSCDNDTVRDVMGWDGLDKPVFLFIEDKKHEPITNILKQWPEVSQKVCVVPCEGHGNLPRNKLLLNLLDRRKLNSMAVIHRDNDFMTIEEAENFENQYDSENAFVWITENSDIEGYFCTPEYLSALYGVSLDEASIWVKRAVDRLRDKEKKLKKSFISKRIENANRLKSEGEENPEDIATETWDRLGLSTNTITGKKVHKSLKVVIKQEGEDDKKLNSYLIPDGLFIGEDLKWKIEESLRRYQKTNKI